MTVNCDFILLRPTVLGRRIAVDRPCGLNDMFFCNRLRDHCVPLFWGLAQPFVGLFALMIKGCDSHPRARCAYIMEKQNRARHQASQPPRRSLIFVLRPLKRFRKSLSKKSNPPGNAHGSWRTRQSLPRHSGKERRWKPCSRNSRIRSDCVACVCGD